MTLTAAALCSGYGGLELGAAMVLGALDVRWYAEIDPSAAAVFAAHHPDVPNLGDVTTIGDAAPVDVVCAGFPCQPVSVAGARRGTDDERWIFDDICGLVGRMDPRPRLLVFENVVGLLTANGGRAMGRVVHGLAALGYVGSWRTLAACDVGAPHRRDRVFIVATPDAGCVHAERRGGPGAVARPVREARVEGGGGDAGGDAVGDRREAPADTERVARPTTGERDSGPGAGGVAPARRREGQAVDRVAGRVGEALADTDGGRREVLGIEEPRGIERARRGVADRRGAVREQHDTEARFGAYAPAVARWERIVGRRAPDPLHDGRLNPRFVEWMMGLPAGWVTDVEPRRTHALRILGNGVVPQQAAAAIADLLTVARAA